MQQTGGVHGSLPCPWMHMLSTNWKQKIMDNNNNHKDQKRRGRWAKDHHANLDRGSWEKKI